jgi:hypothetical protein
VDDEYEPPAWYLTLLASERLSTQPWRIDDDEQPAPPIMWGWRAQMVIRAEGLARQTVRERQEREAAERDWQAKKAARLNRAMGQR